MGVITLLQAKGEADLGMLRESIDAGVVIKIQPGIEHGFQADAQPMLGVQLYVPPGPEQRFRALGKPPPASK